MQVTKADRLAGQGFCLVMRLANPARLPELLGVIGAKYRAAIDRQLQRLKYVHYSRFVPIFDRGVLLIVTEFDGIQQDYVMDFATVLDEEFSFILSYMEGAPRLPVSRYPDEFYDYVARNTTLLPPPQVDGPPFSAYRGKSVLDILGDAALVAHAETAKQPADEDAERAAASKAVKQSRPESQVKWSEVQANVVQGLRALHALHVGICFTSGSGGRSVVAGLAKAVTWQEEAAAAIASSDKARAPGLAVNLGLTHDGLAALEVPAGILRRFPEAYRQGPAKRSERLGDSGESATDHWRLGKPDPSAPLHAVLSLWADHGTAAALHERATALLKPFAKEAVCIFEQPASRFDKDDETVHFGYRDNISQPRIQGVRYKNDAAAEPRIPVGDILLGTDYQNSRGSSPIADLPVELAQNGTYAALRVIEQHVDAFENMLAKPEIEPALPPHLTAEQAAELIAAKLLGRWRNGMPLAAGDSVEPPQVPRGGTVDNAFDFWNLPSEADRAGSVCPFGSHIRRMNPRAGLVVGIPQGRRIVRRAMPYGPKEASDSTPRGLVGLFFCADLANQFEFVQHAWANGDVSAPGLARSVDPFIGTRDETGVTPFVFNHAGQSHTLKVPRLTTIRGSAYLLMPSRTALNWLGSAGWKVRARDVPAAAGSRAPIAADAPGAFNVGDPRFTQMPHRFYAHWRKQSVLYVGPPYDAQWVLSYSAVTDALRREDEFVKPGKDRGSPKPSPFAVTAHLDDGLFFQDLARHKELRPCLESRLYSLVAPESKVYELARAKAEELLNAAVAKGVFDVVTEYAAPLTTHVFMSLALPKPDDVRTDARMLLDTWVRKALMGHSENAPLVERVEAGSATFALRGWLHAFLQGKLDDATVFGVIKGCPAHTEDVRTNTALHFALGGYLSTEFLITTGVYNLLTSGQWSTLGDERELMGSAIEEMLRFDAPFMMADRWIKYEATLAGKPLKAGSNVTLVYGAANRDPDVFVDPDRFDITRFAKADSRTVPHHLGFGWGEYDCIGQRLARWTASVAFNCLLDRLPDARIGEVGPWISDPYYRSLKRLTLTV